MGSIHLLDCTLRDGGYINDWNFGHDNLVSIFERIVGAGIEMVEIGFLDERREFDLNRSIMPNTDCVRKIYGKLERKQTMVVGMIDFGTCGLENIRPCDKSYLDGIRVIFKKHLREPALRFCKSLKEKGYKVFVQLVSVTSYSDEEMMSLISLANQVEPWAVSMVDTYGLMHQDHLLHYFRLLNEHLNPEIMLGYHGHNNFQMGYANCIAMLSNKTERALMVDGSLYGMGKGAGNVPIELIAMHMNHGFGKKYHISQLLEAIDVNITQFHPPVRWGYNMFYYLAASNNCHPNYVTYLLNKKTLSVKSVNEVLSKLQGEKKLLYDKKYIEKLYAEYQKNEINDEISWKKLEDKLSGKKLLLIGPGVTVNTERKIIVRYLEEKHPFVIAINYIPDGFRLDYIFLSNSKRYTQLATKLSQENYSIIATSNVTGTRDEVFEMVLNFSGLMDEEAEIIDNSLVMFLKVLIHVGCKEVTLAGFDGYSSEESNYYNQNMEYDFVKQKAEYLNSYTSTFLQSIAEILTVNFLTSSKYDRER